MAKAAVTTSMKKIVSSGKKPSRKAAAMGEPNMVAAWIDWLIPLMRVRCSCGTNCGRKAPTAGTWTAEPMDLKADAARNSHRSRSPAWKAKAAPKVTKAMPPSAIIIKRLRS